LRGSGDDEMEGGKERDVLLEEAIGWRGGKIG